MNQFLMSVGVMGLGLVMCGSNEAFAGKSSGNGSRNSNSGQSVQSSYRTGSSSSSKVFQGSNSGKFSNYNLTYGTKFSHGYFYKGSQHCHWTSWYWNSTCGCYFYWCPSACSYYYWYAPTCCYYPASYVEYAQPTCYAQPAPSTIVTVNVAGNGPVAAVETPPSPGSAPVGLALKKPLSP
ncbi:MAG TPA: hypothetical protein VGY77_09790 [Gemmataceae bacterium]|nr:hypothetical protein [Gemmataceae bacterium]